MLTSFANTHLGTCSSTLASFNLVMLAYMISSTVTKLFLHSFRGPPCLGEAIVPAGRNSTPTRERMLQELRLPAAACELWEEANLEGDPSDRFSGNCSPDQHCD